MINKRRIKMVQEELYNGGGLPQMGDQKKNARRDTVASQSVRIFNFD